MGLTLMVEMLDDAPGDLSATERLVLVALAEQADDATRTVPANVDARAALRRRTGMSRSGLKKTLARLAGRDLDVRVAIGADRAGRPVYAHEGQPASYRVPVLRGDLLGNPLPDERGPEQDPTGEETQQGPHPAGPDPRSSDDHASAAIDTQLASAVDQVRQVLGPCDDAEAIALEVRRRKSPADLARYIAKIPAADLARFRVTPATSGDGKRPPVTRCAHGEVGGERILGRGEDASRKCVKCEAQSPAWQPAAAS